VDRVEYVNVVQDAIIIEGLTCSCGVVDIERGDTDTGHRKAALWAKSASYYPCGFLCDGRLKIFFWVWWSGGWNIRAMDALPLCEAEYHIKRIVSTRRDKECLQDFGRSAPAVFNDRGKPPQFGIPSRVHGIIAAANHKLQFSDKYKSPLNRRISFAADPVAFQCVGVLLARYSLRLFDNRRSIRVLPVSAMTHFDQHTEVDGREGQGSQREEHREICSTPDMVSCAPISVWPRQTMPDKSSDFTKTFITIGIVLFCAVLMWFGAPALMVGIDQSSPPLLIVGILALILKAAAILYVVDLTAVRLSKVGVRLTACFET
jgi:hypothetical protein